MQHLTDQHEHACTYIKVEKNSRHSAKSIWGQLKLLSLALRSLEKRGLDYVGKEQLLVMPAAFTAVNGMSPDENTHDPTLFSATWKKTVSRMDAVSLLRGLLLNESKFLKPAMSSLNGLHAHHSYTSAVLLSGEGFFFFSHALLELSDGVLHYSMIHFSNSTMHHTKEIANFAGIPAYSTKLNLNYLTWGTHQRSRSVPYRDRIRATIVSAILRRGLLDFDGGVVARGRTELSPHVDVLTIVHPGLYPYFVGRGPGANEEGFSKPLYSFNPGNSFDSRAGGALHDTSMVEKLYSHSAGDAMGRWMQVVQEVAEYEFSCDTIMGELRHGSGGYMYPWFHEWRWPAAYRNKIDTSKGYTEMDYIAHAWSSEIVPALGKGKHKRFDHHSPYGAGNHECPFQFLRPLLISIGSIFAAILCFSCIGPLILVGFLSVCVAHA